MSCTQEEAHQHGHISTLCCGRREELEVEEDLDAAYQGYLQRQGVRAEAARQKRKRLGMEGELGSDEEADPTKPEYEPGSDAEEPEEVK